MCKKKRLAYNSTFGLCPACHASCSGAPAKDIFPIVRTIKTKTLGLDRPTLLRLRLRLRFWLRLLRPKA